MLFRLTRDERQQGLPKVGVSRLDPREHHDRARTGLACGWALHEPLAEYEFVFSDREVETETIIPYGGGAPTGENEERWHEESNIQDWHPSHPRFRGRNALEHLITQDGDPLRYERYLYCLQWLNPRPAQWVRVLRVCAIAPERPGTLAILAVSVLPTSQARAVE